jgi:hypothetical protein
MPIEDQGNFLLLSTRTESFNCQKHSKLEGHIEPREFSFRIDTHDRNIMDPEFALVNDGFDLREPIFA